MPQLHALALAAALLLSPAGVKAQSAAGPAPPRGPERSQERNGPITLQADEVRGRPDLDFVASGQVQLQRGRLTIRTDQLSYDTTQDRVRAVGNVQILTTEGDRFSGPDLDLRLQRFEGVFLQPEYFFARTGAGGRATRIDFLDSQRAKLESATYTSCKVDGSGTPAWLLSMDRVKLDFEANEGIAAPGPLTFTE